MSQPLTIVATALVADGHDQTVRDAQTALVADSLAEPGCLRFELHQSVDDPRILVLLESWESEEAWAAHMEGPAMARFQALGAGKLLRDFVLYRMAQVAG